MLGASGAVGTATLAVLLNSKNIHRLTLLGRKKLPNISADFVQEHLIDIHDPQTYSNLLNGHSIAVCTLGVGEPSKMSKEEFVKIDKTAVLNFAMACKKANINHFELLASVGINSKSSSLYLKTKGELVDELIKLDFDRLSIFKPSMILTPKNRYGISQAIILKLWPLLKPLLIAGLRKFRGVPVEILGEAIANNIFENKNGIENLEWDDFYSLSRK